MDDFDLTTLNDSRNEWVTRLLDILTPNIIQGFNSMYNDALTLCIENEEEEKYLMTFQNFLTRIPNWNNELIANEVNRIIEESKCNYIQDLITCVHVIQLKALTCIRVGYKQKQIDLDIPEFDSFVHKVYIKVARKLYSQIYLFETEVTPLQKQKYTKEFEALIKSCILNSIRDSIPIEQILKNYLDESTEEDLLEYELEKEEEISSANIKEEIKTSENDISDNKNKVKTEKQDTIKTEKQDTIKDLTVNINEDSFDDRLKIHEETNVKLDIKPINKKLTFNNVDSVLDTNNVEEKKVAPKDIDTLEEKYKKNHMYDQVDDIDDDDSEKITIGETIKSSNLITPINLSKNVIKKDVISLSGVEVL